MRSIKPDEFEETKEKTPKTRAHWTGVIVFDVIIILAFLALVWWLWQS